MSAGAAGSVFDLQRPPHEPGGVGLISHCAHALRTPLNAILGFAQILTLDRDQPLTPVQKERVAQIQTAGWQLLRMIDDTVELARIGAGRLAVFIGPVTLGPVLHQSLARLSAQAAAGRVGLESGPGLDTTAWADPQRLEQIVANLLLGVLQCSRGGGVEIGVRSPDDGGATIWIRGAAPSIALEQLQKFFLPLDHLTQDEPAGQNVQISLALTQKLVELTGGRLQLHQNPDFEFEVQLHLQAAGTESEPPPFTDPA
jgi:signal transduction histidine kinase